MSSINFTIASGEAPFKCELIGSDKPIETYNEIGSYTIHDVGNDFYTLQITDSNGCVFVKDVLVDPSTTTSSTTSKPNNKIVIGVAQDPTLIFNPDASNRNSEFTGFPDANIVTLYLWLKTVDGKPLDNNMTFSYEIKSPNVVDNSTFEYIDVSDQIHLDVQETTFGPTATLKGDMILKTNFIESFFEFKYNKGSSNQRFTITLGTTNYSINVEIPIMIDVGTTYGVHTLEIGTIIFEY